MSEFDNILTRTQVHLRAYIAGLGISPNDVDDLAQDVYLEFYRNQQARPDDVLPERWLKGIARNLCMNHFRVTQRKGAQHREALLQILAQTSGTIERHGDVSEIPPALKDCMAKLPERSRTLVKFRYVDNQSAERIAETVNMTAESVRVTLHRVRATLRKCLMQKLADA